MNVWQMISSCCTIFLSTVISCDTYLTVITLPPSYVYYITRTKKQRVLIRKIGHFPRAFNIILMEEEQKILFLIFKLKYLTKLHIYSCEKYEKNKEMMMMISGTHKITTVKSIQVYNKFNLKHCRKIFD